VSEVKRYVIDGYDAGLEENPKGDLVDYEDYAALQSAACDEISRLRDRETKLETDYARAMERIAELEEALELSRKHNTESFQRAIKAEGDCEALRSMADKRTEKYMKAVQERDANAKDAARYRWLTDPPYRWYIQVMSDLQNRYPEICVIGKELSAAIDTASSVERGK
jgi:hypothetical protein